MGDAGKKKEPKSPLIKKSTRNDCDSLLKIFDETDITQLKCFFLYLLTDIIF